MTGSCFNTVITSRFCPTHSSLRPGRELCQLRQRALQKNKKGVKGYHASGSGNEACTKCEVGKFAPDTGMGDCVTADPGHYVEDSGADAQGKHASGASNSECSSSPSSSQGSCDDTLARSFLSSPTPTTLTDHGLDHDHDLLLSSPRPRRRARAKGRSRLNLTLIEHTMS